MISKSNSFCCVDGNGHIMHHCVHRSLDEEIAKVRDKINNLSGENKKKLMELLREQSQDSE